MNIDEFEHALTKQCDLFISNTKKKSNENYTLFIGLDKIEVNVFLKKTFAPASKKTKSITATISTEPKNFKVCTIADKIFQSHNQEKKSIFQDVIYN